MSLAVLADHMASKGRGPDSMLIHMSPREVQGLQALAKANGGSLTVNPDTGLPEAGFLDKLLPTIIGAGLTLAGVPPNVSAMIVGGVQTVRTGDIGKGIQAGLGAYGGANLTSSMTAAGSSAIGSEAAGQSYLSNYAPPGALEGAGAGLSADMAYNLADAGVSTLGEGAAAAQQAATSAVEAASPFDKLSRGFDAVKANPMGYATKDNLKYLAAAAGPAIMAGMNVQAKGPQTVTKPGRITPYSYDPYGGGYVAASPYEAAPTRAAEGGLMGMAQGGMFDFAQRSEPVVRMADGGIAGYAVGGAPKMLSDEELYQQTGSWEAAAAARDAQNNALNQYNWSQQAAAVPQAQAAAPAYNQYSNEQIASYLATNPSVDIAEAIKTTNADPAAVNRYLASLDDPFRGSTDTEGGSGTLGIYNQMKAQGVDPNELYAASTAFDPTYAGWSAADIAKGYNLDKGAYALSEQLKGNVSDKDWANFMDTNKYSVDDMAQAFGLSRNEVKARYDAAKKPPVVKSTGIASLIGGGTGTGAVATDVIPDGYYGSGPSTGVDYKGRTVSTATPGDITRNPDGTVTIQPNIPGRQPGGFTGMDAVKSAYTAGGGSLGYTPFVPKTIEEFDAKYNKLTGGSKSALDYLSGKTPYSPTPYTPTGEVQKSYAESVLGMPANLSKKMYLFDPATKTYKINPDYAIPTYDKDGKKTYNVTNKDVLTYMATKPAPSDFYNWAKTNNLTIEQIAAATGMPITEVQKMFSGGAPADTATKGESSTQISDGMATGGLAAMARGGSTQYNLGDYSDGGRLLRGPGDGVSDSIPASIGNKRPARLADGEFVVPARIVSELGNGSTEAGARKLYAMMDRIQSARRGTVGKGKVAKNSRADKHLPA